MTDDEIEVGRDAGRQEDTEGGHQPARGIESSMTVANSTPLGHDTGKVHDLESFRHFVRAQTVRHQTCGWSRDDTLLTITSVAKTRQLHEAFGDDQIGAIIQNEFLHVVDAVDHDCEAKGKPTNFPGVITADQLQVKKFAPVMFVVPQLIAEGVTLLAGKPKLGKSWLMLDIALGIASGKPVLGNIPVLQGDVLGLFLEDSERRLQARLRKLEVAGELWPADLKLTTRWRRLDEGGLSDLEAWCRQARNAKAIIIDTLVKLRPATGSRKAQYDLDYELLAGLHKIAHEFQVAIIVVHHTRKADADDVFDTVSGTLGLTGAADTILVLSKRSGKAVLHARGRDIEDSETALKFDPAYCRWVALGDASEVFVSDERSRIQAALDNAPEPMSPKELMLATGIKNRNALDIMLLKMARDSQVGKAGRGKYTSSGKIGKKDPTAEQPTEVTEELSVPANLSDLSPKAEPGGAADERTTP